MLSGNIQVYSRKKVHAAAFWKVLRQDGGGIG
jgi:hypothetical protein